MAKGTGLTTWAARGKVAKRKGGKTAKAKTKTATTRKGAAKR